MTFLEKTHWYKSVNNTVINVGVGEIIPKSFGVYPIMHH